jgi:hypothetical protein
LFLFVEISQGKRGGGKTAPTPEPGHSSEAARACFTSGSALAQTVLQKVKGLLQSAVLLHNFHASKRIE